MVTAALKMALWRRDHGGYRVVSGVIHHSDAGSQYTSSAFAETLVRGVACQVDGTTWLPEGRDHRGALLRMRVVGVFVNCPEAGALAVGRSFDDEGVRGGGQSVDC
ncbi:hypothetical protein CH253_04955 [Rhodococcus sp. 06-156-3C]|nr:hypothetical protein CH280_20115 [Rhodococcus sp. 06-156-4C]OZD14465.1 hypothetical protein CH248_24185 [Rhodococcus sp. 06-156-4a]OZD24799.1 hypothetical protein CH253_04955 [Rhodococcus sp. 06-156-3C]OZD27773.1 hypothetical protein CH247_21095 [Rhodococcus sp. 06-156-3b]OZD39754.1 hypothetical protein CH284_04675 [Rhodococcus sp. 06-156-3]OZF60900.1 hypothetical protein CH290_16555 [Rhodococcus sp. 06-156-4]